MIRQDRFLISHKPFAIDLPTLKGEQKPGHYEDQWFYTGSADAVWFRRKQGVTYACLGSLGLWSLNLREPITDTTDPVQVLSADLDSRYGGDCHGRWDGERYWGAQKPGVMEQHLELLRPMLAAYPSLPQGYDGWWRF